MRKTGLQDGLKRAREFARPTRGFTMMELLVSIAVILILASLTMKGLTEMNRTRKLTNSTETVAAVISQARRLAISDNRIYHVRVENLALGQQYISIYRFKKLSDALNATTEDAIQTMTSADPAVTQKGWYNQHGVGQYSNELVMRRPLEPGVQFETEYDTAQLFNATTKKFKTTYAVSTHTKGAGEANLYYPTPYAASAPGLLPQTSSTPFYDGNGNFTATLSNTILYFNPDGSSGSNALLLLRDDISMEFVQVLKGGIVRTGNLHFLKDFGTQIK